MEKGLTTMGTGRALFAKEQNRGTNGSPGRPKKFHYKRRRWVVKKRLRKKRETQERRDSLEKLSEKSRVKRKY